MEMIRRLVSVAVTAVMLVSFLVTVPVSASPGDIRVPEDYTTIQAAIDNVTAENRTILVNALAYNATETVDVTQSDITCLLYTSTSPRDRTRSRMPSSA